MNHTASSIYDSETYDDFPTYVWNENFDVYQFSEDIDNCNSSSWDKVKGAICTKLRIPSRLAGCKFFPLGLVGSWIFADKMT